MAFTIMLIPGSVKTQATAISDNPYWTTESPIDQYGTFLTKKIGGNLFQVTVGVDSSFWNKGMQCDDTGTNTQKLSCVSDFCELGSIKEIPTSTSNTFSDLKIDTEENTITFTVRTYVSSKEEDSYLYVWEESSELKRDIYRAYLIYKVVCSDGGLLK